MIAHINAGIMYATKLVPIVVAVQAFDFWRSKYITIKTVMIIINNA